MSLISTRVTALRQKTRQNERVHAYVVYSLVPTWIQMIVRTTAEPFEMVMAAAFPHSH